MDPVIKLHYDRVRSEYTSGVYRDVMVRAKDEYFESTGVLHEDEEGYETKMNMFNDWYVLRYVSKDGGPFMEAYLEKHGLDDDVREAFLGCNHSLFQYTGRTLRRAHGFKDVLHTTKFSLPRTHRALSMVKGDLLIGRVVTYGGRRCFLDGMTFVPGEVGPILARECKKIRKTVDPQKEYEFLMEVEKMNTRYSRFGHVSPSRFFAFD